MDRISVIKQYVDKIIDNLPNAEERKNAYIHTYGVAQSCSIIAGKRGLNTELAYISGLLHDIYAYYTGNYSCHAQSGAEMARPTIRNMNIFSNDERVIILSAIFYHANKDCIHGEYDEILKDADILQPFLNDSCIRVFYRAVPRLNKILDEFNIVIKPVVYGEEQEKSEGKIFKKSLFADIAEELASKSVCGERDSKIFMDIIKYYPEATAYDELKNGWCAAFIYDCALKAGLELPIRQPPFEYRFAGVGTWYEWGKANNFCFCKEDGFEPSRGDIIVYNNIISADYKQKDSAWHDHIGIVLSSESDFIVVAEGNINNQNVSGITKRKYDNTIGCFIRIPDDYIYEGWKCDYVAYLKQNAIINSLNFL